jgi:uncharacterized protein (TIGR02996 family)
MTIVALDDALERWRAHRTVAFAQLVTAIGRRVPDAELDAPEPDDDAAIERLLARPDDPRVALRLAAALVMRFDLTSELTTTIVDRIAEIRDVRAIAMVWRHLDKPHQHRLSLVFGNEPDASDDDARRELDALEDADGRIAALWRTVAESPYDVERRLVLADALIERGNPRGHVIALQCRPDGREAAWRILEARRYELLGETALLLDSTSRFDGGLLASIRVGTVHTPSAAWDRPLDQRELCALYDASPGYVSARAYAKFLAGLARMPTWVRIERVHLDELRSLGATCAFRNAELSLWPPPRDLANQLLEIAAYAPALEGLAFRATHWPPLAECVAVAREVRERVPTLQRFFVGLLPGHGNAEDDVEAARSLPFLEIVDAPAPAHADWPI